MKGKIYVVINFKSFLCGKSNHKMWFSNESTMADVSEYGNLSDQL